MTQTGVPAHLDGLVFSPGFYGAGDATRLLRSLLEEVCWHADSYEAFGRRFEIPRLQAWFSSSGIQYRYVNNLLPVQPWAQRLLAIKRGIEAAVDHEFNSVLATYYRDGDDYVGWHADDERELGDSPVIASLSLGASRQFCYRAVDGDGEYSLWLNNGDLLLMQSGFQHRCQHCVPADFSCREPRINLTFRKVVYFG